MEDIPDIYQMIILAIDFKPLHVYHMDPTIAHLLFLPTQET